VGELAPPAVDVAHVRDVAVRVDPVVGVPGDRAAQEDHEDVLPIGVVVLHSTKLFILVGFALMVTGVVAGLLPIEPIPLEPGLQYIGECGRVFDRSNSYLGGPGCAAAWSNRTLLVWGSTVLGTVLASGAFLMDPSSRKKRDQAER
jgi:hypothetical protein